MKLKYKKMIIMISMCTMGIGLVTFSITGQSKDVTTNVEKSADVMENYDAAAVAIMGDQEVLAATFSVDTPIPTITPEVESEAIVAKQVVNELEKDAYEDVNTLISKYLNAKLTSDVKNFKSLVNDASLLNIDDLVRKAKYIEEYQNLTCYTRKGPEEGTFIVYAYHEVKFKSIDAPAPGMNEFYVKTNEDGKPYIFIGEVDADTNEYMNTSRESEEVMDLIFNVNEKLTKTLENDSALAEFCLKLEESAQEVSKNN